MAHAERKPNTKKLQGKRILVVEDQPLVSEILTDLLRRYDHPSQANTGRDALEQIKQKAPDIVLLDLSLPDMNGLEVVRLVRGNEKTRPIPILAMSGSPMDKTKCLEMGCNDFIHKPFSVSTLLVRLSALIPGRSRSLNQKCPVIANRRPCSLQLFRTGTLDDSLKPSLDVYECAKGHRTYYRSKTKS
jgi:DNA-binding response OmpR family regulator